MFLHLRRAMPGVRQGFTSRAAAKWGRQGWYWYKEAGWWVFRGGVTDLDIKYRKLCHELYPAITVSTR